MIRFFGKNGLFLYSAISVIVASIQVLKLTKYFCSEHPVALGTVVFSTIFAIDNILTEYYGAKIAKKCVWLSFSGYLFFAIVMKIAVLHTAVDYDECVNLHQELRQIFSPSFVLFFSSLISYIVSQLLDIFMFSTLKKLTESKFLLGRSLVSMGIATFVDNFVFSVLVWMVFADHPISWSSLWTTYILTTYAIRLLVAALCVPLVKWVGVFIPREQNVSSF
jgi:uncharacterized integral membrane protein (TIGR00697 family)